jgi:inner membrane protein
MEPITNALAAAALGRAGLNKVTPMATPMLIVSGLAADVDWATRFGGAGAFMRWHHSATHSLFGSVVLIAVLTAIFWLAGRKYPKFAFALFPAIVICTIGTAMHLLLDLLNSDGIKLLWPFSRKWFAWDLADRVDTWVIFSLLCGLLLPELFRLVLEEIGSRPGKHGRQRGAIAGLILVALFITGRAFAHQRALALLDSREYRGHAPLEIAAFPHSSNPFDWSGVVETDIALATVDTPLGPFSVFDPELAEVYFKPESSLTLTNAMNSRTAIAFLEYARFPLADVEAESSGYVIRLRDMRFVAGLPGERGIIAVINLNKESLVAGEHLEFDIPTSPER